MDETVLRLNRTYVALLTLIVIAAMVYATGPVDRKHKPLKPAVVISAWVLRETSIGRDSPAFV